jgi:toxin secretion/phage lysis holin
MDHLYVGGKWAAALAASFWLGLPETVHLLIVLMAVDFATGLISGYARKELDSAISYRGIAKKSLTLILIGTLHLAAKPLGLGVNLGEVIAIAYAVNELISIVENCAKVGVYVPAPLLESLAKIKKSTSAPEEPTSIK